jgi:hypothetical protein
MFFPWILQLLFLKEIKKMYEGESINKVNLHLPQIYLSTRYS